MSAAAWHPDPSGKHELRYWDGSVWTEHVSDAGVTSVDPLVTPNGPAGDVVVQEQAVQQYDAQQQAAAYQPQVQQPMVQGTITGDLIDGRYGETDSTEPGPSLQNKKLLRVRLAEPIMARQGAMVAYQGDVAFNYQGGGAAKFLKKALTGEGLSLMRVEGRGDVFLANAAENIHILRLENSGISINGKNVLAFSAGLAYDIERVKGGSIAAGGLFNTSLRGTGWVAITTDGDPVVLNPAEAPTFADAQALVAWSIDLQTGIKSSMSAGALIGRGSGEAFQVAFGGHGFVIVQPSEGAVVPPHTH